MRAARPAVLLDIGGVLSPDHLPAAAAAWAARLGITPPAFLAALFSGNDDQILVGRTTEPAWWHLVATRLHLDDRLTAELRADLAARRTWDDVLTEQRGTMLRAAVSVSGDIDGLGTDPVRADAWLSFTGITVALSDATPDTALTRLAEFTDVTGLARSRRYPSGAPHFEPPIGD